MKKAYNVPSADMLILYASDIITASKVDPSDPYELDYGSLEDWKI